jgi:hypothetical protein
MSSRRLFLLVVLGGFLEWAYRGAWGDAPEHVAGWAAYAAVWLAVAVVAGLIVAYVVPADDDRDSAIRTWAAPVGLALLGGALLAAGHYVIGAVLALSAVWLRWRTQPTPAS